MVARAVVVQGPGLAARASCPDAMADARRGDDPRRRRSGRPPAAWPTYEPDVVARRPDAPAARRLVRAGRARAPAHRPAGPSRRSGRPTTVRPSGRSRLGADVWAADDAQVVAAAGRLVPAIAA